MARRALPKELEVQMQKPLAYESYLNQEQQQEAMDIVTAAIDKHLGGGAPNFEAIAKQITEGLSKQCGASWHCIVGEGFSYALDVQEEAYLLCFYQGNIAVLCFKG
ncbi:hypothetical protein Efla_002223 [Eimeria flavescens]